MTMEVGDEFTLDEFVANMTITPPNKQGRPRIQQPRQRVANLLGVWVSRGFVRRNNVRSGTTESYTLVRRVDVHPDGD